jgi:hypothetical protein
MSAAITHTARHTAISSHSKRRHACATPIERGTILSSGRFMTISPRPA